MGTRPVPESPAAAPSGGKGEPPGPERELASSTQERDPDRDEKTATAAAGTPGSLFTPRARQPQPGEAGRERAGEAEPAATPDARPADSATAPAARDKTRTADDAGPALDTDQAGDGREAEELHTGDRVGGPVAGRAKGAAEGGGDGERDDAGQGGAGAPGSRPEDRADRPDDARDVADGDAASLTGEAKDLGAGQADIAASGHDDVAAPGAGATADDEAASEAKAAPDRKPPPADDHDGKPEEKGTRGPDGADSSGATPMDGEVTIVPGVSRYHRRGCILIRFLSDGDLETMTREAAEAAGSVPCKACQPDKPSSDF
jgi:hypothetical protein